MLHPLPAGGLCQSLLRNLHPRAALLAPSVSGSAWSRYSITADATAAPALPPLYGTFLYTALATKEYVREPGDDVLVNMVTAWILVTMFFIILAAAHPTIRQRYHDHFEAFHRFAGWTTLVTFWIQNMFSASITARKWEQSLGYVLLHSANFWFICLTTCCTLLSWSRLRLRRVSRRG